MKRYKPLKNFLTEYSERNIESKYKPVAVGRYGIRTRESIYSKELAKDYSKNKLIYNNTLTLGMGSTQIDIGILTTDETYSVSPAYRTYKINGINANFLRYCLECRNQDMFTRYAKRGSRQGKTIDHKRWLKYEIPFYEEQKQDEIVNKLDNVLGLIEKRRDQLSKLDELIKSQFIEMFGNIQKYKKSELKQLSNLISIERGGSPRPISKYITDSSDGVNWIKIGDASESSIYITNAKEKITLDGAKKSRYVKPNDFLLSNSMSFGKPYILKIDGYIHDGWLVLRSDEKTFDNIFLHALLSSEYAVSSFKLMAAGSVVKNLNKEIVGKLKVPVPEMRRQKEFSNLVKQIDKSKFTRQKF